MTAYTETRPPAMQRVHHRYLETKSAATPEPFWFSFKLKEGDFIIDKAPIIAYKAATIAGDIELSSQIPKSRFLREAIDLQADTSVESMSLSRMPSAVAVDNRSRIIEEAINVFEAAKDEEIEDGVASNFERALVGIIGEYGGLAIDVITDLIHSGKVAPQLVYEALQVVGSMSHPPTLNYRFWLLQDSLRLPSIWIREGAVLGLSSLNDVRAIRFLRKALENEKVPALRRYIERVCIRLEKLG